jgi:hypothetical protein
MRDSDKGIMCFAGSIRGAIAFGLAISIESSSVNNRSVLISSTLVLVFLTTIVFGAMMPSVVQHFKKDEKEEAGGLAQKREIHSINDPNQESVNIETYSLQRYDTESISSKG